MKLVSVTEMRTIEAEANALGLPYAEMMERAGAGVAQVVEDWRDQGFADTVIGLVGSGNNGGDTLVALRHLAEKGWKATAYLVKPRPEGDPLIAALQAAGGTLIQAEADRRYKRLREQVQAADVLIDGVLGTGISLPLSKEVANVLAVVQAVEDRPFVVAVDCPSGVDADSGDAAPETIPADLTVCMAAVKTGLLRFPAFELCGGLSTVDLGFPANASAWNAVRRFVITEQDVRSLLPARPASAYKGTFGTAMIAAGSINYTGAVLLAGEAAYRSGAGLVRMAIPGPLHAPLAGQIPEATWLLLPHETSVIAAEAAAVLSRNLDGVDALLVGCGMGQEDTTAEFMRRLLAGEGPRSARPPLGFLPGSAESNRNRSSLPPLVIDADGLRLLARVEDWPSRLPPGSVLTPHPGEMSALTGLSVADLQAERLDVAVRFAKEWQQVVVLKGALTVVALPDGSAHIVPVATAALARAGTGDVLAGLICGLIAQGLPPGEAARAGAWLHAQAGLAALEGTGHSASVLARDVLLAIGDVLAGLK